MKKMVVLIFFLASNYLYSDENFSFNFNLADAGIEINYASNDDKDNVEFCVEILTAGIEHKDTNIGMGFSPLKYWYFWRGDKPDSPQNEEKLSFLNFNINRDFLNNDKIFLGPFCSVNYMFLENAEMKWNNYIFTAGMRFVWAFSIFKQNIVSQFLSSDIGYRIINGKHNFHFNISIDIITLCYSIGYSQSGQNFH